MNTAIVRNCALVAAFGCVAAGLLPGTPASATTSHRPNPVRIATNAVAQTDVDGTFVQESIDNFKDGSSTVRFAQQVDGATVLGGFAAVTVGADGTVVQQTVEPVQAPVGEPAPWSGDASLRAKLSRLWHIPSTSIQLSEPKSVVVDAKTVEGLKTATWAWELFVSGGRAGPSDVIATANGDVLSSAPMSRSAVPTPLVCRYPFVTNMQWLAAGTEQVCTITQATDLASQIGLSTADVTDRLRLNGDGTQYFPGAIQDTLNYYSQYIGVDINEERFLGNVAPRENYGLSYGEGGSAAASCADTPNADGCTPRISAEMHMCGYVSRSSQYTCQYANAAWMPWRSTVCSSGFCSAVFFGEGWAADDIVAHELTHGVSDPKIGYGPLETQALAEALSDVMSEAVDQRRVDRFPTDPNVPATYTEAPDVNWSFGEDVGHQVNGQRISDLNRNSYGPYRSLRAVTSDDLPKVDSQWRLQNEPHYMVGPVDRFAWLLANGDSTSSPNVTAIGTTPWLNGNQDGLCNQNPVPVSDLSATPSTIDDCTGITMMTKMVYRALENLSEGATFYDFAHQAIVGCEAFVASSEPGFTSTTCNQVRNAAIATNIYGLKVSKATSLVWVRRGSSRTVKATLKSTTNALAGRVPVVLQTRSKRTGKWKSVASGVTNNAGLASFKYKWSRSQYYRIATVGSSSTPSVATSSRHVSVG